MEWKEGSCFLLKDYKMNFEGQFRTFMDKISRLLATKFNYVTLSEKPPTQLAFGIAGTVNHCLFERDWELATILDRYDGHFGVGLIFSRKSGKHYMDIMTLAEMK